ncbi:hypothetical protein [Aquabacter cavernae]|uniref:hypothetical protein n=1 Tax=Aquabacter cavernae TaxID=2496029 RepID=UPI000F8DEDB2|nr:hypothetical protein [Aquabacter cavernae]
MARSRSGTGGRFAPALPTLALLLPLIPAAPPASAQPAPPVAAAQSARIPLLPRPDRSGFANFVAVQVGGGRPAGVLLDTGSTGLRIRAEAMGPDVQLTDIPLTYSYSSGNVLTGVLGRALVAFPGSDPRVATPRPIAIHVVQSITCKPDVPRCPGWMPGEMGVMGVGYSPLPVFNPLAQLGGNLNTGFIVAANDLTDPKLRPHLEVGLTAQNSQGFARVPLERAEALQPDGLTAWNTKSVPACFSVNGGPPGCFATVFDTGAGTGSFEVPGLSRGQLRTPVPRGAKVTTEVKGALSLTIEAGGRPWTDRYRYEPPHGHPEGYNSGAMVFRHVRVLFDAAQGQIGFAPLPSPATASPPAR